MLGKIGGTVDPLGKAKRKHHVLGLAVGRRRHLKIDLGKRPPRKISVKIARRTEALPVKIGICGNPKPDIFAAAPVAEVVAALIPRPCIVRDLIAPIARTLSYDLLAHISLNL